MKLLVDMNLSPTWCAALSALGIEAVHWSAIGDPRARDSELMAWARENGFTVFTHDLDFTTILATTNERGPSVVQMRTQGVLPEQFAGVVGRVLVAHQASLERGAIVTIDEAGTRVRILPLGEKK